MVAETCADENLRIAAGGLRPVYFVVHNMRHAAVHFFLGTAYAVLGRLQTRFELQVVQWPLENGWILPLVDHGNLTVRSGRPVIVEQSGDCYEIKEKFVLRCGSDFTKVTCPQHGP